MQFLYTNSNFSTISISETIMISPLLRRDPPKKSNTFKCLYIFQYVCVIDEWMHASFLHMDMYTMYPCVCGKHTCAYIHINIHVCEFVYYIATIMNCILREKTLRKCESLCSTLERRLRQTKCERRCTCSKANFSQNVCLQVRSNNYLNFWVK